MTADDYMQRALFLATCGRGRTSPNPMVGAVREVQAPERLVFSFAWEQGGAPGHGPETTVAVSFVDLGDGRTELILRQEGFATAAGRDEHRTGWSSALDRFADYLAGNIE